MSPQRTARRRITAGRTRVSSVPDPTREKLLEVAEHVFADRGYQAATIREMCVRAGANVAAVNYHFGGKLGLYTEVLQQSIRAVQIDAIKNALDKTAPPEEILRAVIRARLQGLWKGSLRDWHFRLLTHELAQPSPAFQQFTKKVGRPIFNRLLELVGRMIGLPPEDEKTRLCAVSVIGQILVYVFPGPFLVAVWPELKMTQEQVERIADHIADFSIAYLQEFRLHPRSITLARAQRIRK
jgi:TetR/AcrR family transcriptional regulator, regulator of cefoperazone and chloramphenicol sensitivity